MPVQTRARRLVNESPHGGKKAFKILQYLRQTVGNVYDAYIEKDCRLDQAQITRLGNHKYSSLSSSVLDELCMQRFWNYVVQFYPTWLAPNLITLIGLIVNLITVLILSHYCYTATEEAPWYAYVQAAIGLFIYQTLDATDGKQARRTDSSSPLGELFDHGCDSMTQVFVTLNLCYAMRLGLHHNFVFAVVVFSVAMFYCAHWVTYCTGQLRFSKFDVTEAQWVIILILLTTAVFGPGFWDASFLKINIKLIFVISCVLGGINQFYSYLKTILFEGSGKNGSTVADTSVIFPVFPLLAVILPFSMIYTKSPSGVYDEHITLFSLCFAAVGAKATNRLVIAHMSRSELGIWDWIYLSPMLMFFNQYYDFYFDEYKVLVASTIYAYTSLMVFCIYVCRQFCDYLDIYCFMITKRHASSSSTNSLSSSSSSRSLQMDDDEQSLAQTLPPSKQDDDEESPLRPIVELSDDEESRAHTLPGSGSNVESESGVGMTPNSDGRLLNAPPPPPIDGSISAADNTYPGGLPEHQSTPFSQKPLSEIRRETPLLLSDHDFEPSEPTQGSRGRQHQQKQPPFEPVPPLNINPHFRQIPSRESSYQRPPPPPTHPHIDLQENHNHTLADELQDRIFVYNQSIEQVRYATKDLDMLRILYEQILEEDINERREGLELQAETIRREVQEMEEKEKYFEEEKKSMNTKIIKLQNELKKSREKQSTEVKRFDQNLEDMKTQMEQIRTERTKANVKISELRGDLNKFKAENQTLKKERELLEKEKKKVLESQGTNLANSNKLRTKVETLQKKNSEQEMEIKKLREEIAELKDAAKNGNNDRPTTSTIRPASSVRFTENTRVHNIPTSRRPKCDLITDDMQFISYQDIQNGICSQSEWANEKRVVVEHKFARCKCSSYEAVGESIFRWMPGDKVAQVRLNITTGLFEFGLPSKAVFSYEMSTKSWNLKWPTGDETHFSANGERLECIADESGNVAYREIIGPDHIIHRNGQVVDSESQRLSGSHVEYVPDGIRITESTFSVRVVNSEFIRFRILKQFIEVTFCNCGKGAHKYAFVVRHASLNDWSNREDCVRIGGCSHFRVER